MESKLYLNISTKQIEHLTIGAAWIFLSSGWWGGTLSVWFFIIFNTELSPFLFLFIGNFFIPIALLLWIYSFAYVIFPESKVIICLIFLVICVLYEIYLIISLTIDPSIIANMDRFKSTPKFLALYFQVFALIVAVITGVYFSLKTMKIGELEVKWRGRFLLIAFVSFFLGTIFDAIIVLNILTIIIVRVILITSCIEYYFGFFLPEKIRNILIKKE